ncbi:NUDIX domain-containing protein [Planomicrobium okeanokoites]|uniref:NUDIX domain-containing protein n=1 Tax=Planomicrobium okeanokoites TaxID=244 RepID=UPI0035646463
MKIRNSAKAVIIESGKILLTKNEDREGSFYLFPGGGQNHGETLTEALKRECLEEAGAGVDVKELLHMREYIGKNHEHASFDSAVHQIEYYFRCKPHRAALEYLPPTNPDSHQVGVVWLLIEELANYRIYPKAIVHPLQQLAKGIDSPIYLGDVN